MQTETDFRRAFSAKISRTMREAINCGETVNVLSMEITMTEGESGVSDKSDGKRTMQIVWREEIATIAGNYGPHDTRESWLNRAARRARISFRQAKALWYGECVDPKYSVAMSVRGAAEQARKEALELVSRFETAARNLHEIDPDFHQSDIASLIEQARALRGLVKPGAGD